MPLPVGPIRKLKATTAPTSKATILDRTTKSYQDGVVDDMRTTRNRSTTKPHTRKTMRLRTDADQPVHCMGLSTRAAASHSANANDILIHTEHRCATKT